MPSWGSRKINPRAMAKEKKSSSEQEPKIGACTRAKSLEQGHVQMYRSQSQVWWSEKKTGKFSASANKITIPPKFNPFFGFCLKKENKPSTFNLPCVECVNKSTIF
jgi:hypothetical protein